MKTSAKLIATFLASSLVGFCSCSDISAKNLVGSVQKNVSNGKANVRQRLAGQQKYIEAVHYFDAKNYAEALTRFQFLDAHGFCCDLVHYYIGECCQLTNQTVAAEMNYQWVLAYSKDANLRRYADYGNQTVSYYSAHRTYAGHGNAFASYRFG